MKWPFILRKMHERAVEAYEMSIKQLKREIAAERETRYSQACQKIEDEIASLKQ